MPIPNLWSKLEDAGDITAPQLGTGGAEIGAPNYQAAKFGNGILSYVNNEGCKFPTAANSINLDKGTIEFWTKMRYTQISTTSHEFFYFVDFANGGILFEYSSALNDFRILVYSGGVLIINIETTGMTWNVDDLLHFGITWNRQGNDIGGLKTLVLKIDNVEKVSTTDTWDADTILADIYIGIRDAGTYHSDAVIDNIKTYDTCKTDFSDKDTEGVEEEEEAVKTLVQACLI